MDWSNEEYVKRYRRDTDDDLLLSWEARALWDRLLVKFDRAGLIETRRGARGLAVLTLLPADVVERVLPELLEDGRLEAVPTGYFARNFLPAQEARKSDKLRQRESRVRRAADARTTQPVTKRDGASRNVTDRHEDALNVTDRHTRSHGVTLSSADPLLREPPARAHAIPRSPTTSTADEIPAALELPDAEPDLGTADNANADAEELEPRARGRLAESTWNRVSEARVREAQRRGLTGVLPLPKISPAHQPAAFGELLKRIREEGAAASAVCEHVITALVEQARAENDLEFLGEKAFLSGSWRTARTAVLGAPKSRAGPRAAEPQPLRPKSSADDAPPTPIHHRIANRTP